MLLSPSPFKLKHPQVPSLKYILQPSVQYPAACFTWMTAWPPNSGVCCTPTPQLSYSLSQHGSQSYPCTVVGYTVSLSRSAPPTHPPRLPFTLRRAASSPWPPRPCIRTWQIFSVKDQTGKTLGFTRHTWSLSRSLSYFKQLFQNLNTILT